MKKDCKIENGILTIAEGRTVIESHEFFNLKIKKAIIPEGVTTIEYWAFGGCKQLEEIVLPSTLTTIASEVFALCPLKTISFTYGCPNMIDATVWSFQGTPWHKEYMKKNEFFILGKLLLDHKSGSKTVTVPEGIEIIGRDAFCGEPIIELVIPSTVKSIQNGAFASCNKLKSITFHSNLKLENDVFYDKIPSSLLDNIESIYPYFSDKLIKKYLLVPKVWQKISPKVQAEIFIKYQAKPFVALYKKCINDIQAEALYNSLVAILPQKATVKDCNNVASCMILLSTVISGEKLEKLYSWLISQKNAEKALDLLKENVLIADKLNSIEIDEDISPTAEQITKKALIDEKIDVKGVLEKLKTYYGITPKELPTLLSKDGKPLAEFVIAYLLTAHEEGKKKKSQIVVEPKIKTAGVTETVQAIINELDFVNFESTIFEIVNTLYLHSGTSKKKYLAYPICRYANEELMKNLTQIAPSWLVNLNAIFKYFYKASFYNNTKSAMLFIDSNNGLNEYAKIRGTTAQNIRDSKLACFESDNDAKLKKALIKNHNRALFRMFLSGEEYSVKNWIDAYLKNPLLKNLAQHIVWSQGNKTFLPSSKGLIQSNDTLYELTEQNIKIAHPIEIDSAVLTEWQKLFAKRQLKQPFEQIWEPVINVETFSKTRFAKTPIPYSIFDNEVDRGITIKKFNECNDVYIYFKDCNVQIERLDFTKHFVDNNDRFLIKSFDFEEFNRQTNHIIAYLDIATAKQRVLIDDVTVNDVIESLSYAKIIELISLANANNATNVLAMLLDFKNKKFADFDPMDEFILE